MQRMPRLRRVTGQPKAIRVKESDRFHQGVAEARISRKSIADRSSGAEPFYQFPRLCVARAARELMSVSASLPGLFLSGSLIADWPQQLKSDN